MRCQSCQVELPDSNKFATINICEKCFEELSEEEKKEIEEEMQYLSKISRYKEASKNYLKLIIGLVIASAILIILSQIAGHWALYILGVGIVSGIFYAICESVIQLLVGIGIIAGGSISYLLVDNEFLTPLTSPAEALPLLKI
ncbi:MAG: hypothetical protein R6V04_15295 [bacterium]